MTETPHSRATTTKTLWLPFIQDTEVNNLYGDAWNSSGTVALTFRVPWDYVDCLGCDLVAAVSAAGEFTSIGVLRQNVRPSTTLVTGFGWGTIDTTLNANPGSILENYSGTGVLDPLAADAVIVVDMHRDSEQSIMRGVSAGDVVSFEVTNTDGPNAIAIGIELEYAVR